MLLQVLDLTGHNIHQWLDQSPYAFQNWHQPSPQNTYHGNVFSHYYNRSKVGGRVFKYFHDFDMNSIQPQYNPDGYCAAVLEVPSIPARRIPIPCQQALPRANFICESKIKPIHINVKRTLFRAERECPRKSINFQSSCLHIVNYVYKQNDIIDQVCFAQGMSVFHLPFFLLYFDPKVGWLSWDEENFSFVNFLISMFHRWPDIYDANTDTPDIIVGGGHQSYEKLNMFGVQFSEANLAHIHVLDMHNSLSQGILYIVLCDNPMLISDSFCLHYHSICNDGTCILNHYVCDGTANCPDASDETECTYVCSFAKNSNLNTNCFFSCRGPECLCNDLYFSCELGGCVPWSRVCDGVSDCPHGEDEQYCNFIDMSNTIRALFVANNFQEKVPLKLKKDYQCTNSPNISQDLVNDLVPDCPEQDDEDNYYAFLKNGSRTDFFNDSILCEKSDTTTCVKNYRGVCYPRYLHCIHEAANS